MSAPAATVKLPVLDPLPRANVPVCTSTAPVLVNGIPIVVVPVPADLRKVPLLLKLPELNWLKSPAIVLSVCIFQSPELLMTAPEPVRMRPSVHVSVPALVSVRVTRSLSPAPLRSNVAPTAMVVLPVPLIVPAVHVDGPKKVTVSEPDSVPPD